MCVDRSVRGELPDDNRYGLYARPSVPHLSFWSLGSEVGREGIKVPNPVESLQTRVFPFWVMVQTLVSLVSGTR